MRLMPLAALLVALPGLGFAVGSDDDAPPTPTETTTDCADGTIYNPDSKTCEAPQESRLDDDGLYKAARELAYAGRIETAQAVLAAMADQSSDRVLTYWGFTHRQLGRMDLAMEFYREALAQNPDNLLARAYMGMGLLQSGDTEGARLQLAEIRARGGQGSWPETALAESIAGGKAFRY